MQIILGVFLVLHGLVHLLYAGQSGRFFELSPGLVWPDGAWAFSRLLGADATRWLANLSLVLIALGFVASALGLFMGQAWWRPVAAGGAMFSAALFMLMWDGKFAALDAKGGVGILLDLAILAVVFILKKPS
jgi:hypothetical protein